jgi:hypothetical protein
MPPNLEYLQLLSAVCLTFLRLSTFFTSQDKAALTARAKLDDKEPFYANLCVELKSLSETLSAWDQSVRVPDYVLTRVLDVFESRLVERSRVSRVCLQFTFTFPEMDKWYTAIMTVC